MTKNAHTHFVFGHYFRAHLQKSEPKFTAATPNTDRKKATSKYVTCSYSTMGR